MIADVQLQTFKSQTFDRNLISTATWRVFTNKIDLQPNKVKKVTLAACALHNYLLEHQQISATDANDEEVAGLCNINAVPRCAADDARTVGDLFCQYFNNEGSVGWQEDMI